MDVNEWCTSALFFDSVSFNPCIAFTLRVKSSAPIPHLKMNETRRKMTTIAESWLRQSAKRISTACQLSIHGSLTSALWEGNSTVFRWDNKTELSDGKILRKLAYFKTQDICRLPTRTGWARRRQTCHGDLEAGKSGAFYCWTWHCYNYHTSNTCTKKYENIL